MKKIINYLKSLPRPWKYKIDYSSGKYDILDNGTVLLFDKDDPFKIDIECNNGFKFSMILKFINDNSDNKDILSTKEGNTVIYNCLNFNNTSGIGIVEPLNIATVDGKELFFIFWTWMDGLPGTKQVRHIIYTIYSER